MSKSVTRQIKEQRQREAAVRQAEYNKLTLQQKLDKLPAFPRAAKQRAKLMALKNKPSLKEVVASIKESSFNNDTFNSPREFTDVAANTERKMKAKERRAKEKNQQE